jgi:hypothetical protein
MHTGDKYLDDPAYRDQMENAYNNAPNDTTAARAGANPPYRAEQGGFCRPGAVCSVTTRYRAGDVNLGSPPSDALFSFHTHQSEGRPIDVYNAQLQAQGLSYSAYDFYHRGYSPTPDSTNTVQFGIPTYIIRPTQITRIDPNGTITTFTR